MKKQKNAFTLLETIIVLAIFVLAISGLVMPLSNFLTKNEINNTSKAIMQKLETARSNAQMNLQTNDWGVAIDDDASNNGENPQYIFFRGSTLEDYPDSQEEYPLPENLQFKNISFDRGNDEVVFLQNSGNTLDFGSMELYNTNRPDIVYTFSINPLGVIELTH